MQAQKSPHAPGLAFAPGGTRVHVVGVAGTGLRGLVELLHARGAKVSGSEMLESPLLDRFRRRGIDCRVGHASGNLEQGTAVVLVSAAVSASNPEVKAAKARSIPVFKYAECLGALMAEKKGIAVAGTHGKTTTTAMVASILEGAGLDPTFLIGGEYPALGGSSRWGQGPHFVAEACEFDRSFLNLRPHLSVVTNIEEDHLDYFSSLKDIQGAFAEFAALLPEDGYLVFNRDDPNSAYLREFSRSAAGSFSLRRGAADWWAEDLASAARGYRFRLVSAGGEAAPVELAVPGLHNVKNALAAAAVCRRAGVPIAESARLLAAFTGVRRRFEVLAAGPILVIDDYAHHPTEVAAVLQAARERHAERRLIAVFQPHQHSRLKAFAGDFARVLAGFDRVLVTDVFSARDREEDVQAVRSEALVGAIRAQRPGAEPLHTPGADETLAALRSLARAGDAVVFLGAGSITDVARAYAREVREA
jgi:UDP-N-acetylmuramate--alanine ligase